MPNARVCEGCEGCTRVHTGACAWRRRGAHGDALGDEARDATEDDMHLELEQLVASALALRAAVALLQQHAAVLEALTPAGRRRVAAGREHRTHLAQG